MRKDMLPLYRTFQTAALTGILGGMAIYPASVWAQPLPVSLPSGVEALVFNSTPHTDGFEDTGRPANQTSTGSRAPGSCLNRLVALVPGSEPLTTQMENCSEPNSLLALTLDNRPTFWFYLPPELGTAAAAEFVLLDDSQRPVYREQIALSRESGIVGVRPNYSLEVNQIHRWVFQIELPDEPNQNPAVEGFVQHVQLDSTLNRQLAAATSPQERIRIFANHGIWHDALTELAALSLTQNPAGQSDWANLLDSVGLGAIANLPLLHCCISQPVAD